MRTHMHRALMNRKKETRTLYNNQAVIIHALKKQFSIESHTSRLRIQYTVQTGPTVYKEFLKRQHLLQQFKIDFKNPNPRGYLHCGGAYVR